MRVLFIQKMAGISGSELYLLQLLPALRAQGVAAEMLSISVKEDAEVAKKFNCLMMEAGVPVHVIETESVFSWKLIKQIYGVFRKGNFDLLHTHLIHADFWGAAAKLLFNRSLKLVSTKHGYDEGFQARFGYDPNVKKYDAYFLISYLAEKLINRSAAVSEGLRSFFIGKGICSEKNIETIVHGINFEAISASQPAKPCRYFARQLLVVGRLIPYKGQRFVISCLPGILQQHPDAGLVLVGTGSSEPELRQMAEELQVSQYIRFEGFQPHVHPYLAQSDIVVVPSTSEGFGIVILEAWYHQKPVVAFDVPAPNTIIRHNESGILVPAFDIEYLKEKLLYLLANPEAAIALGSKGKELLETTYSEENLVSSTIELYKKVLQPGKNK